MTLIAPPRPGADAPRVLLIDNYDSFTYNLAHLLCEAGAYVDVRRHDAVTTDEAERLAPTHLVVSPGPGRPSEAGVSAAMIETFAGRVPVLGVCLGHQCIVEVYGGVVERARRLMHGKVGAVDRIAEDALLDGLPELFEAGRYHSLAAIEPLPDALIATARDRDGEVMALRHRDIRHLHGVQFHPESVLTPAGDVIARNFLALGERGVISETIDRLLAGEALSTGDTEAAVGLVMRGEADPAQIAGLLVALRAKGETVDELVGAARAMRAHVVAVHPAREDLVDTAGTGGDGSGTFNISTTAALVAAACGAAVAKHGNRAASSRSGSADVLEALGVPISLTPEQAAAMIERHGFGYLHAPDHHPAMRFAGPVRRSLGVRTVFNLLGPLTNPAGARRQVIGVYAAQWVEPMARALAALGCEHGMVVHGAPGIDELSPCGATTIATVRGGEVSLDELDAREIGIGLCALSDLAGGDPQRNAQITLAVLGGEPGPAADATALNAAAALVVAGRAADLGEGVVQAREALRSGAALATLSALRAAGEDLA